jgi:hypothetical protein
MPVGFSERNVIVLSAIFIASFESHFKGGHLVALVEKRCRCWSCRFPNCVDPTAGLVRAMRAKAELIIAKKNYPHSSPKAQCDNTHMLEFLIAKKSPGVQGLNGGIMP